MGTDTSPAAFAALFPLVGVLTTLWVLNSNLEMFVVRELQSRPAAIACLVIIGLGGLAGWGVSLAGRLDMTAILAIYALAMLAMLLVQMRLLAHKGVPFRGAYAALPLAAAPLLIHLLPRIP